MDAERDLELLFRLRRGEFGAADELHARYHHRLVKLVELRLDAVLRRRVDPHDIVQEAWVEIVKRLATWRGESEMPLYVWMRLLTLQCLAQAQRYHLATNKRDAGRDVSLARSRPSVTSAGLADVFVASATTPALAAQREELRALVTAALEDLDEIDRELVLLRQFEGLSNDDAALELGLEPSTASKRFLRTLVRLRPTLSKFAPDSFEGAP